MLNLLHTLLQIISEITPKNKLINLNLFHRFVIHLQESIYLLQSDRCRLLEYLYSLKSQVFRILPYLTEHLVARVNAW